MLVGASGGSAGTAQATRLVGTVGPEFTITLTDAAGNRQTAVDPGPYEIEVSDRSDFHTFHFRGPGVDERTEVEYTGTVTWRVTLSDGTYTFLCDVHPTAMRGTLTAGTPSTTPPPTGGGGSGGGSAGTVTPSTKLLLTSGPAQSITLRTAAGRAVRAMRPGTYSVTVRDRSRAHNARVRAPGYARATTLPFRGRQTWRVRLARTGTLRFLCDAHPASMRGSIRIVR